MTCAVRLDQIHKSKKSLFVLFDYLDISIVS
jgi:hypothetical protein